MIVGSAAAADALEAAVRADLVMLFIRLVVALTGRWIIHLHAA